MEDMLGFCVLVMTVLMLLGVSIWFCCCTVESLVKMRRGLKRPGYNALLKQNKHLKSLLAEAAEENFRFEKGYHSDILRRKGSHVSRNIA